MPYFQTGDNWRKKKRKKNVRDEALLLKRIHGLKKGNEGEILE